MAEFTETVGVMNQSETSRTRVETVCWVVGAIVVGLTVLGFFVDDAADPVAVGEEPTYGRHMKDYLAEGIHYLALEHGVEIDYEALRAMLEDRDSTISGGSAFGFWVATLGDSPSAKADTVRDYILEDGDTPSEWIDNMSDKLKIYQARNLSK